MWIASHATHAGKPESLRPPGQLAHGLAAADRREAALVPVAERLRRQAGDGAEDVPRGVAPHLDGRGRDAGDRLPVLLERRQVADHEDVVPARHGQGRLDADAPGAIERHPEALREGRGRDAGRPQDGAGEDPLVSERDAGGVDAGDARPGPDVHPQALELSPGLLGEVVGVGREHARHALDQDDARVARVDVLELPGQGLTRDLGERAGELDAGRAAADDDEGQPLAAVLRIALGHLVGEQHAAADLERVLDALEARGERRPLLVAEVGVGRARGEDEVVVGQLAVGEEELLRGEIDAHRLGQHDRDVSARRGTRCGSAPRCRRGSAPRWPPGRAAAGTGGGCAGRRSSRAPPCPAARGRRTARRSRRRR